MTAASVATSCTVRVTWLDLTRWVALDALSQAELDRAATFRFEVHRSRFVRRRAHYRAVLAAHLGCAASEIEYELDAYGKPAVAGVHFGVSSSQDVSVIALADRELGVDVEIVRPAAADADVARRLFTRGEADWVGAGPAAHFFRCWTRKEAYVKAIGMGLSFPLDTFEVDVEHSHRPWLLRSALRPHDVARWTFADISPGADTVAALAVQTAPESVTILTSAQPEHAGGGRT